MSEIYMFCIVVNYIKKGGGALIIHFLNSCIILHELKFYIIEYRLPW